MFVRKVSMGMVKNMQFFAAHSHVSNSVVLIVSK